MSKPATNALAIIDEAGLGPAMSALPPQRRAFVSALVQTGCTATDAAAAAGYSDSSRATLSAQGHNLAHDPRVQAAILEESQKLIRTSGPMAIGVLVKIAKDETAANRDRVKAATEILNRGGFHAVSQHNVTVTHQTESEKEREIAALCAELGLDQNAQQKLLGKVIEAEFVIVDPPSEIAPKVSASGRKITNPARTAEDRARDRLHKRETPEEKAARRAVTREQQRAKAKAEYQAAAALRGEDPPAAEPDPLEDGMAGAPDGPFVPAGSTVPDEWVVFRTDDTEADDGARSATLPDEGSTEGLEDLF